MTSALEARVAGLAVWGPGLEGWDSSRPVLAGEALYEPRTSPPPPPAILSATERRRTGPVARLALAAAQEATSRAGLAPAALRSVFASGNGDSLVVASILEALSAPPPEGAAGGRVVSPTQFHNSVHNAAAGYWSIATGSRQPATCLGCHDATWPAALLTAMAELASEGYPLLLCVYDHAMPAPLDAVRRTTAPFAAGFVLVPIRDAPQHLPLLRVRYSAEPVPPEAGLPLAPALRPLAMGNAAARSLRVLEALARGRGDSHAVPYLDGHLSVEVGAVDAGTGSCSTRPA